MGINGHIDAAELKRFADDLRKLAPQARKEFPKRLREAAAPIVEEARVNAQGASPRGQIKIGVRSKLAGRNGASIKIVGRSPKDPPLAGLMERGARGSGGTSWRHPVYGNRKTWVTQPTRPYIQPAVDAHKDAVLNAVDKVIADLKRTLGAK